jgi:hypothetical protein
MNPKDYLSICLFSDSNFFALNLLENLLSKNCVVNIVTDDVEGWRQKTRHLSNKSKFSIYRTKKNDLQKRYDYAVFCSGFIKKEKALSDYDAFSCLPGVEMAKTLIIFPFEIFSAKENPVFKISSNSAVIYLGDLLGPRMDLESDLLVPRCIRRMFQNKEIRLGIGEIFYPLFVADAVRAIVRWMFSFGPYGREIFLLGPATSTSNFIQKNQALIGVLKVKYDSAAKIRIIPRGYEIQSVRCNLGFCLTETYKWIGVNRLSGNSTLKRKGADTRIKSFLVFLLFIFIAPFLTLFVYGGLLLLSYGEFIGGREGLARDTVFISKALAAITEKESFLLSKIPLVGKIYGETSYVGDIGYDFSDILQESMPVFQNTAQLFNNILGSAVYDPAILSVRMELGLANIYKDVLFIQQKTQANASKGVWVAEEIFKRIDFDELKNLIAQSKILAGSTPEILGKSQSKTYLVLFENNMELRPTGGFIGSYGLVTFDGGRLSDFTVNDIYSADGQLNGHVEPPAAIKNYLGEANWWFRDSNWDPDFPTSAKRAEWFLDKEIGRSVDGVVAVDLFPIKEILKYTGPVFLPDFNLDISSANLYEQTQEEVQSGFFPGTHKKASFLTALSRSLLLETQKLNLRQKLSVLKSFYVSLEGRRMQIFLHDRSLQNAITLLGWDGSVIMPTCGANCYADFLGVVEANVGVNKANYFIQRSTGVEIKIGSSDIERRVTLNLKNSANTELGPAGRYKVYIRLLTPEDVDIVEVKDLSGQIYKTLSPEVVDIKGRKETGILAEVLGGQDKKIVFTYKTPLEKIPLINSYGLYVRKQAGTEEGPVAITIDSGGIPLHADSNFSLTHEGIYVYDKLLGLTYQCSTPPGNESLQGEHEYCYNTLLARDIFSRFSW